MTGHTVHFTLTNKGGVGKSLIATFIAQYLREKGDTVNCIDCDPMNATFSGYTSMEVKRIDLMKGTVIDERNFDQIIEEIIETEASYVVDIGSPAFIAVSNYLIQNKVFDVLQQHGRKSIVHTILTGSQALRDTLTSFDALATQLPSNADLVVWENAYFGDILLQGKPFQQSKLYNNHKDRLFAVIRLPVQTGIFADDLTDMLERQMTFEDVATSRTFGLMSRSRLHQIRQEIFDEISKAF